MKARDEIRDIRALGEAAIQDEIRASREELLGLRFRKSSGQLENSARFGALRKRIARLNTVLREKRMLAQS